jgi:hypothetical protein
MYRGNLVSILLAVATLAASACSSEPPTATPTPGMPTPEELRDRVVETLRGLSSVRFSVTHEDEDVGTDMGGGITLNEVEGSALFPDRAELTADTTLEEYGLSLDMEIVQIAERTYLRDPISGAWRMVEPGTLPFDFVGMHESVADALGAATGLTLTDGGEVDGVPTFKLVGMILPQEFRGLVPGAPEGEGIPAEAWVGRDDGLTRRVRLAGRLIAVDPPTMVRLLRLWDFDEPVTIEPPI